MPGSLPACTGLKLRFIFNPRSGHNARNPHLLARAREFIATHQLDATIVPTERPRHATDLARQAVDEGCAVIVAIGGDGTMNEVATALVHTPATLGLIPCGSGNGLGRHLGIFGSPRHMFQTLLTGQTRVIDSGLINGLPFFNAAGLGFEAVIADKFSRLRRRGFFRYLTTGTAAFWHHQPETCTLRQAHRALDTTFFTLAIANCDQYGNNAYIAPGARVDDGLLDLTAIPPVRLLAALPLLTQLFTQRLDRNPAVIRWQAEKFTLERAAAGLIHTDGEPHATTALLEISVRPRSLRVLVPAPTR